MEKVVQEALDYVLSVASGTSPYDEDLYRQSCEMLADNTGELTQRVFIFLPGSLSGNIDPKWDKVKAGSKELCSERVIEPSHMRTTYEPSENGQVVVSAGNPVYLKPVGGHKRSTYVKLEVDKNYLTWLLDPFTTVINFAALFSNDVEYLDELASYLELDPKPILLKTGSGVPVARLTEVDVEAKTVTLIPDRAVEAFNPDAEADHVH